MVSKILGGPIAEKAIIGFLLLYFNRELFLKIVNGSNSFQLSGLLCARHSTEFWGYRGTGVPDCSLS